MLHQHASQFLWERRESEASRGSGLVEDCPAGERSHRSTRRSAFARLQELLKKDRRRVAQLALSGEWEHMEDCSVPVQKEEEFVDFRSRLFERPSGVDDRPVRGAVVQNDLILPIAVEEVRAFQLRLTDSAPGADGIDNGFLRTVSPDYLSKLFNLWLYMAHVPVPLRESRTVFIPKKSGAVEPKDFRPITISSCFVRLFHKI